MSPGASRDPPEIVIRYPAMVFVVLTHAGFDAVEPRVVVETDAVWVNAGVLSESEVARLRGLGWNLTTWTNPLDLNDLVDEFDTVRLHHPGQAIWSEVAAG
jgi:hypothetical protein